LQISVAALPEHAGNKEAESVIEKNSLYLAYFLFLKK